MAEFARQRVRISGSNVATRLRKCTPSIFSQRSGVSYAALATSRLSCSDVSADYIQVVAGSLEGSLGFMVRNKSGVVIQGHIPLPSEAVKHGQQPSVFLVNAHLDKIDDRDVMSRLTSSSETMTEHETERSFQHCLIGLLEASLLIEGKYLMG